MGGAPDAGAGPSVGPAPASVLRDRLLELAALPLFPVLMAQGARARRRVPRLPEAAGPDRGRTPGPGEPLRLLLLGESTVAGVGAGTHPAGLAGRTAAALADLTGRPVAWRALGRSGATARDVRDELLPGLEERDWDAAVIALGVNDVLRLTSLRRWSAGLAALAAALAPAAVVLAGVPPLHRFPVLPSPLRDVLGARGRRLDSAAAAVGAAVHVPHRALPRDCRDLFCADGFHPSPAGYALWAEHLAAAIHPRLTG